MISKLTGALALALSLGLAAPAFSQSIEIGRDGIRVLPNQDVREERIDRRNERAVRGDGVSEREAVRIARRGDDIRVDIDRRSGEVLSVR